MVSEGVDNCFMKHSVRQNLFRSFSYTEEWSDSIPCMGTVSGEETRGYFVVDIWPNYIHDRKTMKSSKLFSSEIFCIHLGSASKLEMKDGELETDRWDNHDNQLLTSCYGTQPCWNLTCHIWEDVFYGTNKTCQEGIHLNLFWILMWKPL